MDTATLDDFMSWNEQLAAAIEAGVPLDLGLDKTSGGPVAALEKINALVARRTSQGASLQAALNDEDKSLPPAYRCLMQLSLASGKPVTGLALSNHLACNVDRAWNISRLALLYPAIVCCFAFLGIIGFCLYFVPVLEQTYAGLDIKTGAGLSVLEWLRGTMPYWATVFPVGLILAVTWVARKSKSSDQQPRERVLDWIPGISRVVFEEHVANFSETTAKLLDSGAAFPEALRISAETWNNPQLSEATRILASAANTNSGPVSDLEVARRLPPFLHWALFDSESTTGRVCALQAAAEVYRQIAQRRQERLRIILPLIVAVVVGGAATLLYGLALFVPVIEMLRGLASQYSS
jgi:type II secretory pathway component PulF